MGWFDFLADVPSGVFDVGAALIGGGADIVGNNMAADTARDARTEANAITDAAKRRGIRAIRAGGTEARAYLGEMRRYGAPGASRLRQIVATPAHRFTPDQQIAYEDIVRDANSRVAASGLRGAGRAGVAAVNDTARRAKADFFRENQGRSDAAARVLEGRYAAGTSGGVNLASNEGRVVANTEIGAGSDQAQRTVESGDIQGAATLGNTRVVSDSIGKLSSVIADEQREQDRRDVYRGSSPDGLYNN